MKRSIFLLLVFLSCAVLVIRFVSPSLAKFLGYKAKAGLKITSIPTAKVFLDNKEVGTTPFQDENLEVRTYKVRLEAESGSWENDLKLTQGTLAVINRELGKSEASSSGEVLLLNPGKGVVIASTPDGAEVEIDGKAAGKTPLSLSTLTPGDHSFLLFKDNYFKRSIKAYLPAGMELDLRIDLALSEVDLGGLTAPVLTTTPKVIIGKTPTGYLRVRDKPSFGGNEVERVSTGDSLVFLEEVDGWYKVRLTSGSEGYIFASYASKQNTP